MKSKKTPIEKNQWALARPFNFPRTLQVNWGLIPVIQSLQKKPFF
jgi:hypothetical protein